MSDMGDAVSADMGTESGTETVDAVDAQTELCEAVSETELYETPESEKELVESKDAAFEMTAEKTELLKTEPDKSVFWSGLGEKGAQEAELYAVAKEKTSLEMLLKEKQIDMPCFDVTDSKTVEAWRNISRTYAEQASGEVHALLGEEVSEKSLFMQIEYPALMKNENVTKIVAVDGKTGTETVLMDRKNPELNKQAEIYKSKDGKRNLVRFK